MIKRILFLVVFSFTVNSCSDATDIVQDGELNDERLFTNVENMQLFLEATYARLSTQTDIMATSLLTDEVGLGSAGFSSETFRFNIFTTNGFAESIWNQNYSAINYANRLIRGAALFTPPAEDEAAYNNILAQAYFIRAYCHHKLLTYFSTDMADDNALSVMKLDFVPTMQQKIPRSTNGEIYSLIDSDLEFASANITNSTTAANSWKYININTINAFKARMYLYRKKYELAEQFADAVIATPGLSLASCTFSGALPLNFPTTSSALVPTGGTSGSDSFDTQPAAGIQRALFLMDRSATAVPAAANAPDYRRMWIDQIQGEVIFSLARPNNAANFGSQYNTNQSYINGGPLYDMGRNLFELYRQPLGGGAQDFRRWSFVDRSSLIVVDPLTGTQDNDVLVVDKYPGKVGSHNSNDLKVFRLSEMYFIKAECRAFANDYVGVANALRTVRQARNYITGAIVPLPTYGNSTDAYADILLERRKELCFEGHRYLDLKRLGLSAGVLQTDRFSTDSENASATNPYNISVTDYRFTLPIPQSEINVNPMTQNPDYN